MKLGVVKCLDGCGYISIAISSSFDKEGLKGIYLCPRCGCKDVANLIKLIDFNREKIKELTNKNWEELEIAASVASRARWRQEVPVEQLCGSGLRDNESGEGSSPEPQEQTYTSFMEAGPSSPEGNKEKYERECCKALGIPYTFGVRG